MAKTLKIPVSPRALIQRINRKLRDENEVVRAARGERAKQQLGDFYRLDVDRNAVVQTDVDLEELGRELGVLSAAEVLDDAEDAR